ncbi:MAG: hypothetical protein P0Y60_03370 [Candidatus Microbacterium colombiense]|nr:MAG: hypothetical protein P0Y60_03370 [Microbacterium sp.]
MRIVDPPRARELYRIVLDILYLALTLALFALVSLIAKGLERP